ncbi:MAG: FlgD immunoglobulin-like domain containing protein, partial [Anaerolineae bacterium]
GVRDYAGNQVAAPFAWSFTADRPQVTGDAFRLLTVDGGQSPAVSPDGSQVAFISDRSGLPRVWVMRADDYAEKAKSAKPLTNGSAPEADPAWSPDGTLLAYVSTVNDAPQVWVAAPDGSGAHALTNGTGTSPTWSSDGKTVAFVRDGNLWQVDADGTGLHALTNYPERPVQAVSWQPDGQLLAVDFKLYQETIDLYNPSTGQLTSVTKGGQESAPAWLNDGTLLYTSPAGQNQPDAVWQVNLDGSSDAVLPGSGGHAVGDMQPAPARSGNALAIVSTRNGARNIWLRADLQLAQLDVLPAIGAAPGTPLQVTYTLPADAQVTLEIANVKKLVDNAAQAKGSQAVTWDGTDANGKPVPAGDYLIKLSAQVTGGSEPLTRFVSARVLDAANQGNLQLVINQWANTPLDQADGLHIQVYPQGSRTHPAAEADNNASPAFNLPAGQYDLLVGLNNLRRELDGVTLDSGKTANASIDLALGALQVNLLAAPGNPVNGPTSMQVFRSGDPTQAPVATQNTGVANFVLPSGLYDVQAEYQGVRQFISGVRVETGQTATQEINLGAGSLELNVLAFGGHPADAGGRLTVQAFSPQDHKTAIATVFNNPAKLLLPAGNYDIRVIYAVAPLSPNVIGSVEQWVNGITIQPGETVTREDDLQLGAVKLDILEAAGKPAEPQSISLTLYPHGNSVTPAADMISVNSATLQLLPGSYDVIADYAHTTLRKQGPIATVQIAAGQSTAQTIDLRLGRIDIQVYDASGQLVDGNRLSAQAYPAGKRDASFASDSLANPVELILLSDTSYDLVVTLDGKTVELTGQSVKEGATQVLKLNASDFK